MDKVIDLFSIDWKALIIAVLSILGAIVFIVELWSKICQIFGINFKWIDQKKKDHEMLMETIEKLQEISNDSTSHDLKLEESVSRIENLMTETITRINIIESSSMENRIASREALADRINTKYKHYIEMNGIPEDEYDEFTSLHAAYKGVGGNHTGDAKFEYCINNLKIIPSKIKLDYISKNKEVS